MPKTDAEKRPASSEWQTIETAPKDGTSIWLLSKEYTDPADVNGGPYHHPFQQSNTDG